MAHSYDPGCFCPDCTNFEKGLARRLRADSNFEEQKAVAKKEAWKFNKDGSRKEDVDKKDFLC